MPLGYASYNMGGLGGYGRRPSALEALGLDPVQLTPEDEQSWLRQFASTALSGLSTVGNVLDTPGAAARSLLMGQNPLPGLFDPSLRPSGRDVLESWGALPENQPGFHPISNPWDALGDVAGFAGEVALDPLTYLSLGGSALSKGGQVAKNAGLLPDLARVSAGMGPREARLSTTLGDLLKLRVGETAPDIASRMEAVTRAAGGLGVDVNQVADAPLGSLATFMGMPIGTGDTAKGIARGMDTLGRKLRYGSIGGFSPGSAVARLFNAPTQEATSRIGQEVLGPEIFRGRNEARALARGNVAQDVTDLVREGGKYAEDNLDVVGALRRMFEGVDLAAPEVQPIIERVRQRLDSMQAQAREWGIRAPDLIDTRVEYFPRYLSQLLKKPGGASQVASVYDPAQIGRQDVLRNIAGGTDTINKLTRSNPINDLIEAGAKPKVIADEIANQFPQIESLYVKRGTTLRGPRSQAAQLDPNVPGARTTIDIRNRHQDLATYLKSQGGAFRETGMFANHPLQDLAVREQNFNEAFDTSKKVLTALADDKLMQEAAKSPGRGKGVPLRRLLPKLGYDTDEALTKFASLKGMAISGPDDLKALGRMRVPTDLANDLARFHKGFTGPEAVGDIIGALDSVTNLFKAGVTTPWPAFHVRNLVSGQFQNWVSGQWSAESVKEANAILKGGDTSNLATIPAVKQILAQRGLGPEQAGDVVRELAYQHETTSRFHTYAADIAGKVPQGASLTSMKKDFAGGIGGSDPASLLKAGRQFIGKEKGTDWNPLHQRGIGGRAESTFAPAVAGQHLGGYIEGLNRLSPFIELLRRGVDAGEAAKRVAASQVDYSGRALTTFEREVMTRAFPFYKFTRGIVPYTLRQLWEKPGGRLSQTIQATNDLRGNDVLTPDHVASTAAIPLGENDKGDPRFLTGLGLMHEDALSFLASPGDAGLEVLSRLNPIPKVLLEGITGRTFFQRGPEGGRPLEDLDPTVGRTISNVLGLEKPVNILGNPTLSRLAEQALANSPAARVLTTAKGLTDRRDRTPEGQGLKALNLLTGVRTSTVSERAQDAILRQRLEQAMKNFEGAKVFSKSYLPADALAELSRPQQQQALEIQALLDLLAQRGRERKQAAQKATATR